MGRSARLSSILFVLSFLVGATIGRFDLVHAELFNYSTILVPGANYTEALGINNHGQIVGFYTDTNTTGGFITSDGITFTKLAAGTVAFGINDLGQVVGMKDSSAFLTSDGVNYTYFNAPGGSSQTVAHSINNAGQIVGFSYGGSSSVWHGFLTSDGINFTTFDVPSSIQTFPRGISNSGEIIGTFTTSFNSQYINHGFLTTDGIEITTIDSPLGAFNGINSSGQMVGSNGVDSFLTILGGPTTRIAVAGASRTSAEAINDSGLVVGYYQDQVGRSRGFLASPVPLPATFTLFGTGLGGLYVLRRWHRQKPTISNS